MLNLELGKIYSFKELADTFGLDRSYSFQQNGAVTALILNGEMNPTFLEKAPDHGEILVAKGHMRENVAKKLHAFKSYPTFVKKKTNKWIYVGLYNYHDYLTDPEIIADKSKKAKNVLNEIAGVILLRRVADKKVYIKKPKAA